jgi:malonyl-CoA O-methyltransferase
MTTRGMSSIERVPAPGDRKRVLADNARLHRELAADYDQIHPHMWNSYEQCLQRRDIARMLRAGAGTSRVLELGCGTGNLTLQFLERGCDVVAVDMSPEMLAQLRRKIAACGGAGRCELRQADVDSFLESDGAAQFDVVAMSSVAHHLPDYRASLAALAERLRPGGFLYLVHEPVHRTELAASMLPLRRIWSVVPRGLDRALRALQGGHADAAHRWAAEDTTYADYHYHLDGISLAALEQVLGARGLRLLDSSRYNAHATSVASWLDNFCCAVIRYEQFQRAYFRALWQRVP